MPSAKTDPDQKHALEALWRKWVFPSSGIDRLLHYILSCAIQMHALRQRSCTASAIDVRMRLL